MLKKILLSSVIVGMLCASDMISVSNSQGFNQWIVKNTQKTQFISIGFGENSPVVKYVANSNPIPLDNGKTNFYFTFEANNNRIEFYETYDLFKNYGLYPGHLYFRPGIGFGIDISSGSLSGFFVNSVDYNFDGNWKNWIVTAQMKYFLFKNHKYQEETITTYSSSGTPITYTENVCQDNDCGNQKLYFGLSLGYKF